jgi:hypothetical protein
MDVYLVRRIEDKGVLGIFWGSKADVWDAVDELGDPPIYEAARLKPGAVYFEGPQEPIWQQFEGMSEEGPDHGLEDFSGYTPSGSLSCQIREQDKLRWKQLDHTDEGVGLLRRIFDRKGAAP